MRGALGMHCQASEPGYLPLLRRVHRGEAAVLFRGHFLSIACFSTRCFSRPCARSWSIIVPHSFGLASFSVLYSRFCSINDRRTYLSTSSTWSVVNSLCLPLAHGPIHSLARWMGEDQRRVGAE